MKNKKRRRRPCRPFLHSSFFILHSSFFILPSTFFLLSSVLCLLSSGLSRLSRLAPPLLNEGLQMIQILGKRLAAVLGQTTGGMRPPADELLLDGDVALLLEFLQIHTQVAVGHFHLITH